MNFGLPSTELEQARFYSALREGYAAASARTGEMVRDFRIAGTSVRLRFAGEALIPAIVPGLAYPVPESAGAIPFEIRLWDSETTGVPLAPPPRPREDFTARGNIWGFDSSRYRSAFHWGEGSVNVMDRDTRQAVYWVPSPKLLPAWVFASPLRSILHWWMELNGRQLVHAAAVGHNGRGILIPGRGGSGKSSTSLACLMDGLDFIADDYLAVSLDPEPRVHRLYSTAKLDAKTLRLFPALGDRCRAVVKPGFDKTVLFLEDGFGPQLRESLPLNLVLKPRIAGVPETTLGPAAPSEIERAVSSETLAHLPHTGAGAVEFLDRLSNAIPSAAIHLGTDRSRIGEAIRNASGTSAPMPRDRRPFVSLIVHFREADRAELKTLADMIEAQQYPRTELVVTADGPACRLADEAIRLPGTARVFPFDQRVINAVASNRGIRESFAELLMLLQPGDRFPPGALDLLVDASGREPDAAWIQGRGDALRGALIRKNAFRRCGLFHHNPLYQGRECAEWMKRAGEHRLAGLRIDAVTLHPAQSTARHLPHSADLGVLRTRKIIE